MPKKGDTKEAKIRNFLVHQAKNNSNPIVTYTEVGNLVGWDMDRKEHRKLIAKTLGDIADKEYNHNRPPLNALVVLSETGLPGKGFFAWHLSKYKWLSKYASLKREEYHKLIVEECIDYWSKNEEVVE